jgi:large subunit ribosomal protein L6e
LIRKISLGPHKLNGVSLRRVNQIYVIATSTKLDLSSAKFDTLDDKFFKRVRPAKKNADKDIFDAKKEVKISLSSVEFSKISLF